MLFPPAACSAFDEVRGKASLPAAELSEGLTADESRHSVVFTYLFPQDGEIRRHA